MTAAEHAKRASELMEGVENRLKAMSALDEMQRLELAATGRVKALNSEVDTTINMARNHALIALALQGVSAGTFEASGDAAIDARAVATMIQTGDHRRRCSVCQGPLEPDDEGPECDPTGCPGRSGA